MTPTVLDVWDGVPISELRESWGVDVVEAYRVVGSTNDRAMELAGDGAESAVVLADEQTAGRGRRGSEWISPPGAGLLMSVLMPEEIRPVPHLTLGVGLAVAEAIEEVAPGVSIGLKWPNDLFVKGKKVGGILTEAVRDRAVVGVGINVTRARAEGDPALAERATSLEESTGNQLSRSELCMRIVSNAIGLQLDRYSLPARAVAEFGRRDVLAGAPVASDRGVEGVASGIAPDGAYLIRDEAGTVHRLVAGRVIPR